MAKNSKLDMNKLSQEQMIMIAGAIKNAKDISCGECGGKIFNQGTKLKEVSKLLTGEAQDTIYPIPALFCIRCFKELILDNPEKKESSIIT